MRRRIVPSEFIDLYFLLWVDCVCVLFVDVPIVRHTFCICAASYFLMTTCPNTNMSVSISLDSDITR